MDKVSALLNPERLGVTKSGKPIYSKGITSGRYMEDDIHHQCIEGATFLNWGPEFPLKKCTYRQYDTKPAQTKTATVIMLNPQEQVLAKWLVASCMLVKGDSDITDCTITLAKAVIELSGSQFVIAGIVLEDERITTTGKLGEDGIQEAYIFRDGVTVDVEGGIHWGFTKMFSDAENAVALDPSHKATATGSTSGPARIQNTTKQMYLAYMGTQAKDVEGVKWLDVVRDLYQDAWRRAHSNSPETVEKYRNDLMVAKCYSLMGIQPPKK
jgi:hypothetical protein